MRCSVFFTLLLVTPFVYASKPYKVVCYLGSWANYRPGDGKFIIEDIDASLCTHLMYGFAKLSEDNRIAPYDPYLDLKENYGLGGYERFNNLKKSHPGLKTLIAIGGWNEGSTKYSRMASNPSSRQTFVSSCVDFLSKYGFDGLDLDWEYPANRGGQASDKQNFVSLIKELRDAFQPREYLLTAAVSAGKNTIDSAYDIPALGRYLDFINLMAYDFHGGWEQVTGHNAPLYPRPGDTEANKLFTVDYAVKYWLSQGCPAEKLVLGMPLYGRTFTLKDPNQNGIGAPVTGKGMAGEFTREPGMMGYNEICIILKNEKIWIVNVDPFIQAPYAFKGNQWIGYDNPKSIYLKVQYLKKMNLGGGMVWSLETDDFHGRCHGQKYPLLKAINDALGSSSNPDTTLSIQDNSITPEDVQKTSSRRPDVVTVPPAKPTPEDDATGELLPCPYAGYFRHPQDCKLFYVCLPKSGKNKENIIYPFRCGEGTVFSQALRVCMFPYSVPGCS